MGTCSSTVPEEQHASHSTKPHRKSHRAKQRSLSSSLLADPTTAKVAHITPRQSIETPQQHNHTLPPPHLAPCDVECYCPYESEHKELSVGGAVLSAVIVIESPPPSNRHLLLASADTEGRPPSSSHSADTQPTLAVFAPPHAADLYSDALMSPHSTDSTALPHSVVSLPASPIAATSTNSQQRNFAPATLSASSSPKTSISSPHSPAHIAACPVHARAHSLSILQVLREVNHSRSPSLVCVSTAGRSTKEEDEAKQMRMEEEGEEEEHDEHNAIDERWKNAMVAGEEKEWSGESTENVSTIYRIGVNIAD